MENNFLILDSVTVTCTFHNIFVGTFGAKYCEYYEKIVKKASGFK